MRIIIIFFSFLLGACSAVTYKSDMESQQVDINKPVKFPHSKEHFEKRLIKFSEFMFCKVNENRECLGFSKNCKEELIENYRACIKDDLVYVPDIFYSKNKANPVSKTLVKCIVEKQRDREGVVISAEACMKVDALRRRAQGK